MTCLIWVGYTEGTREQTFQDRCTRKWRGIRTNVILQQLITSALLIEVIPKEGIQAKFMMVRMQLEGDAYAWLHFYRPATVASNLLAIPSYESLEKNQVQWKRNEDPARATHFQVSVMLKSCFYFPSILVSYTFLGLRFPLRGKFWFTDPLTDGSSIITGFGLR